MGRDRPIDPGKVAVYIRWSTDDQAAGTTLEVQLEGCRHYVLSQGWTFSEELLFVDDGYSGGTLDRPALGRLRSQVAEGKVDCVVVFKLDRLSRSVVDMVNLVLEEWDGLTHVKSAREPVDTTSSMGKQFFYMLVSFAEWERSVIRERTAAGRLARAREGYKAAARAPYGYRHGAATGSYVPDPAEAPVVQRIFDLYLQGAGAGAIAAQLNAESVPFRAGAAWNERTLLYMLSNPVYTGTAVYGRRTRNPRRAKGGSEPYWVRGTGPTVVAESPFIPALVAPERFAQVQHLKARRVAATSPRAEGSPYLITGLARCRCGSSLYARRERRGSRVFDYYACLGKKQRGAAFCSAPNLPRPALDGEVERALLARFGDRLVRERYHAVALEAVGRELQETAAGRLQVEQQIARLEAQERKLRQDYREQALTVEEFRTLRRDVLADLHAARSRLDQAAARHDTLVRQRQELAARLTSAAALDRWAELSAAEQKHLLRCFAHAITAWTDPSDGALHLEIAWHASDTQAHG